MNVVRDTSIVGRVEEAIMTNAANNMSIRHIELTTVEMAEFIRNIKVTTDVGTYFGSEENPIAVNIRGIKKEGDVPSSLWYMGVRIIKKD